MKYRGTTLPELKFSELDLQIVHTLEYIIVKWSVQSLENAPRPKGNIQKKNSRRNIRPGPNGSSESSDVWKSTLETDLQREYAQVVYQVVSVVSESCLLAYGTIARCITMSRHWNMNNCYNLVLLEDTVTVSHLSKI